MKNKTQTDLHRFALLLFLVVSSVLLAGCVPLNQLAVEQMPGNTNGPLAEVLPRYEGLQTELAAAATNNQTLRLLIVHGMGISEPGYSFSLVDRMAAQLNLKLKSPGEPPVTNFQGEGSYVLSIRTFGNGPSNLCAYELTWSPMTTPIKTSQFALDFEEPQIKSRQIVNNDLKTNLVDCALSDVALYLGKFRAILQQPITNAIHRMEQDSAANNDPIAIITHSLASYMVVDTLKTMDSNGTSHDREVADNYASRVKQIFMMANQLPLLELSDRTNYEAEAAGLFEGFYKLHNKGSGVHARGYRPELQIVAFSDPNDLLSFKLRQHDLFEEKESGVRVRGFNVSYTVEHWSIASIVAWPAGAHDNWWTDPLVPQLVAFGHDTTQPRGTRR